MMAHRQSVWTEPSYGNAKPLVICCLDSGQDYLQPEVFAKVEAEHKCYIETGVRQGY